MWSDNETNIDCIDFENYVNAINRIINDVSLHPCSIGVFGDWGSGKSSLMKMISDRCESEKDLLVMKFNGWLFEGYEDAKTVLMGRIVDEIVSKRTLSAKAKDLAFKLFKKIDFMKVTGTLFKYGLSLATMGPTGIAVASVSDALNKFKDVKPDDFLKRKDESPENDIRCSVQEFHKNFEELLDETKLKKIIVLIDDLDRCYPETIIATLEAIKLFLFAKNTIFIIGADENLIKYAIRKRFPDISGENAEVGRDYLEKLIQFPVKILPLSSWEIETYINLLFSKLYLNDEEFDRLRKNVFEEKNKSSQSYSFILNIDNISKLLGKDIEDDHKEVLLLSSQITPVLTTGLNGNPRQCKRFLNTLLLRYEMASYKKIALQKRILAKLMLLEYFKPLSFKAIFDLQLANNGIVAGIDKLEKEDIGILSEDIPDELENSFKDNWFKEWIKSEPHLQKENLQSYFYFSRDKLFTSSYLIRQRMSPTAQDILSQLCNESEAIRETGLKSCSLLSDGDSTTIFESLTNLIKKEEDQTKNIVNFKILISFCDIRKEQLSQLFIFFDALPDTLISIAIIPLIERLSKENNKYKSSIDTLIDKWKKSKTNTRLANILKKREGK